MHGRLAFACFAAALASVGCAEGGGGGTDGSTSMTVDGGTMMTHSDSGRVMVSCDTGEHLCGGGCIEDLPNLPENGCRLGCGEACPTPPDGVAGCDDEGACTVACEPPAMLVDGTCTCEARTCEDMGYTCGAPDDGCGNALDCGSCGSGGECVDGTCSCPEDDAEPNDGPSAVSGQVVAAIPETNTWEMSFESWTLHDADDEDWYRFTVEDTGVDNPTITVTLSDIPAGSDYDLAAYYVCAEGGENSSCSSGGSDNTIGRGCSSSSSGTTLEEVAIDADCDRSFTSNDSGALYVRVTSARWGDACAPYGIDIHVAS